MQRHDAISEAEHLMNLHQTVWDSAQTVYKATERLVDEWPDETRNPDVDSYVNFAYDELLKADRLIDGRTKGYSWVCTLQPRPLLTDGHHLLCKAYCQHKFGLFSYLLKATDLAGMDRSTAIPGLNRSDYNEIEISSHPSPSNTAFWPRSRRSLRGWEELDYRRHILPAITLSAIGAPDPQSAHPDRPQEDSATSVSAR